MTAHPTDQVLRPLGAFERTIDLYMHRNPVQFSLAAELGRDVTEQELTEALRTLQQVHPLLAAEVDRADRSTGAVFRHAAGEIPVRVARDTTWEHEAAVEQTVPIAPAPGPLARAVLLPGDDERAYATVVVTFAHQITDGRGALRAAQDLASILAGSPPTPVVPPAAQEDLLVGPGDAGAPEGPAAEQTDAAPSPPGRLRPFDGALPTVQGADLGRAGTRRLRERARTESCTVQPALCAAVASALAAATGQERVRINVPIDLRRAVGLDDGVVVRFGATLVALDHLADSDFWDLARSAAAQLAAARDPGTLRASARMLAQHAPTTPDEAEAAMLAATNADIEITNLGSVAPDATQDVRALWGPTMTTQVAGEQILGVVTHDDVLRMVNLTHDPVAGLVDDIRGRLEAACR